MELIKTRVITQERILFEGVADSVIAPAINGYLGVLPGHAPLMAALGNGTLKISRGATDDYFAVFGGFLQVKGDHVIVLADSAVAATEIDLQQARDQVERAEDALSNGPAGGKGWDELNRDVEVARVRLKTAGLAAK